MRAPQGNEIVAGDVLLSLENVSLAFGGVKAISDVSFDVRKGVIAARVKIVEMKTLPVRSALEQAA